MSEEEPGKLPDPEAIYRLGLEELKRQQADRRERFIASGPLELRPLREQVQNSLDGCERTIAKIAQLKNRIAKARQSDAPPEELERLEDNLRESDAALQAAKGRFSEASRRLSGESLEIMVRSFPPAAQTEARAILLEKGEALKAVFLRGKGGSSGALAGCQFRLLMDIDDAKAANDMERPKQLESQLQVAKAQMANLKEDHAQRAAELTTIRESFEKRLKALKGASD